MSHSFGEEVYQRFVARGERSRFHYRDLQVLRKIQSLEELRALCESLSGEQFPEEATAEAMLEACSHREADAGDAEEILTVGGAEGCLLILPILPFLILGAAIGSVLKRFNLHLRILLPKNRLRLFILALATSVSAILSCVYLHRSWCLWCIVPAAFILGSIAAWKPDGALSDNLSSGSLFFGAFLPVGAVFAGVFAETSVVLALPTGIACALGTGAGYGSIGGLRELFRPRKGKAYPMGQIDLSKPR